jgi:serine/threonine protein kinase/formylglycine-generating enzyme required for sulfatase activity
MSDPAAASPAPLPAPAVAEASPTDNSNIALPAPPIPVPGKGPRPVAASGGNPPSHRDDIVIPDYTLLKRIGSGAYGEVWLAQSVTGALRAVKIVWREDFELTKTFHREFEGIQQFEPISRGHPCLVHILHVGWNEQRGFYYCVMELADDAEQGANIPDVQTYVPRTLTTDMRRHGRLDPFFCRDAGVYLADALHYMHNHGLTHRDIKPSNIIFVGGVCKLADIGLVAALGERTFVGTEGFVPPEGPGTPQADLYSLGKVLYEMSSGKDRMEFPEVPDSLSDEEWPFWLDLNKCICKACENDLDRRYATAADFAAGLQHVGEKRPEAFLRRFARAAIFTLVGSFLLASGIVMARHQQDWSYQVAVPTRPQPPEPEVPRAGSPWQNRLRQWFSYKKDRHVADLPVEAALFRNFLQATARASEYEAVGIEQPDKRWLYAAVVAPADADDFCAWMTDMDRRSRRLDADHEYAWRPLKVARASGGTARPGMTAIICEIVGARYGTVNITTIPSGATVIDGERVLGKTPLQLDRARATKFDYTVSLPGYKDEHAKGDLREGQAVNFNLRLKATGAVVFDRTWQNSLGMKMVPLGRAMLGATETRRADFAEFSKAVKLPPVPGRLLDADLSLPVTLVSRAEAEQFCRWLSERERALGLLEPDQEYRLPTDDEWSMAADLTPEPGATPAERNERFGGIYPWGFQWPPPSKTGNFLDVSADPSGKSAIPGYNDGFAGIAPVASLRAGTNQLHDLSGNVWEWVSTPWKHDSPSGVLRGGSWQTGKSNELLSSHRKEAPKDARLPDAGFRIILWNIGTLARGDG